MHESHAVTILARRFPAKRAFVTGAGSGLGRAFAMELGASVSCYAGDVANESFAADSITDFASRAGGLDLMINNAGVAAAGPIESTPAADWRADSCRAPATTRVQPLGRSSLPLWFLRRVETLRDAQLARSGPQPR
jgi:hypothetical protein